MKRVLPVLLSGLILLVSFPSVFAAPYTLVRLSTGESTAHFINNSGQIAGYIRVGVNRRATLFDPTRGFAPIDLGTLGGNESEALCINDKGQIVGWAQNSDGQKRATLFDPTGRGNNIDLGTLGGTNSQANAINENDQIVGEAENSSGQYRATVFDSTGGGNNLNLGGLGGHYSSARTINDQGQIMGRAYTSWLYGDYAAIFDPTGGGNNTNTGTHGWIASINELGQPVGSACGGICGAVRYTYQADGAYWQSVHLGAVCNWFPHDDFANCINNNGLVVGISCLLAAMFDPFGTGSATDLNELAPNRGDWVLTSAEGINDRNEIVGLANGGNAYLLTPDLDGDGLGDFYPIGPCDLDHDGNENLADFALFSGQWQRDNCTQPDFCNGADTDHDGVVHLNDLVQFVRFWLSENGG